MLDNQTADRLICAVGRGDMSALETLYTELSRAVFAFARSIVRDDSTAQDIMQDTFVRLHNGASAFRPSGTGRAWIMQIARNLSLNAVTRRPTEPEELIAERAASDSTQDAAETRVLLLEALASLDDTQRQIVTLHAVSGMTLAEVAEVLGEPLGTVKWRNAEAMKRIRGIMNEGEAAAR